MQTQVLVFLQQTPYLLSHALCLKMQDIFKGESRTQKRKQTLVRHLKAGLAFHTQLSTSIGVTRSPHNGTMTFLPYVCSASSVAQVTSDWGGQKRRVLHCCLFVWLWVRGEGTLRMQGLTHYRQHLAVLNMRISH